MALLIPNSPTLLQIRRQILMGREGGVGGGLNAWFIVNSRRNWKKEKMPTPEEEMDDCEPVLAAEPKAKDPFAHLPKSAFVMDKFKRKYSNEDTMTVALPHFWENFDHEGYSICLQIPRGAHPYLKSCNLITGMFQHLDKQRKNVFVSVILFGPNNDSCISGSWVFRGQELAFTLSDWQIDYKSYDMVKE
ncbi:elongation factor 1-gamma-like [Amphiprion ocellaris]|uniref:elongation factor 1-gamma-like n=1 Tax=Amphiprion ocellaris TaxID=80972 RepID=UPI002410FF60|nr:elongation factor 1-gamma-like [Amphiprion ocellaris]